MVKIKSEYKASLRLASQVFFTDTPLPFQQIPQILHTYHHNPVTAIHNKILKSAGLPHIRLHDLHHTFATLALQNGVDVKTVSSILGHHDAGFTLRTYTHVTTKMQDEAAATMGRLIGANV